MSIGFALVVAPEFTLISLQTSISVKDALGSSSMTIYSFLCVLSLFVYVPLVAKIGRKKCLIIGELPSVAYTIALMHQNVWTVTFAAVVMGIAESILFSAAGAIVSSFSDDECHGDVRKKSIGIFLTTFSLVQIASSIMPKVTLTDSNRQWNKTYSHKVGGFDISSCGRNDCPLEYAFKNDANVFRQLIPTHTSLLILLGIFVGFQVLGIVIHCVVTPNDRTSQFMLSGGETQEPLNSRFGAMTDLKNAFYRLIDHLKSKLRLMTIPLQIQYGAYSAFLWSEVTRAYISCPLGVENIGICLALIYTASAVVNIVFSRYCSSISQLQLYWSSYAFETAGYTIAFVWQPSVDSLFVLYVMGVFVGITHAMRRISSYAVASVYFDDMDSSYLVQTGSIAFGCGVVYALTSVVCVYVKIYVLALLSVLSTILATVAHCRYY